MLAAAGADIVLRQARNDAIMWAASQGRPQRIVTGQPKREYRPVCVDPLRSGRRTGY